MVKSERAPAFTLIELLVVISVIALLIAILLPALTRARNTARQVVCASNARQIAAIWLTYTADHQGEFPYRDSNGPFYMSRGGTGFDTRPLVEDYTQSLGIFYCPNTENGPDDPGRWNAPSGGGNTLIDYDIIARWYRRTSGVNPTSLINYTGPRALFLETIDDAIGDLVMLSDQMWGVNQPNPSWFNHAPAENVIDSAGWEGGNVSLYDGSTSFDRAEDMQAQVNYANTVFVFY